MHSGIVYLYIYSGRVIEHMRRVTIPKYPRVYLLGYDAEILKATKYDLAVIKVWMVPVVRLVLRLWKSALA